MAITTKAEAPRKFDIRRGDGLKMTVSEYLRSEHAAPSDENELRLFSIANTLDGSRDSWELPASDFLKNLDKKWHGTCPSMLDEVIHTDGVHRLRVTTIHMTIPRGY